MKLVILQTAIRIGSYATIQTTIQTIIQVVCQVGGLTTLEVAKLI